MDIQFFFCTVIMSDYRQGCLTLVCVTTFDTAGCARLCWPGYAGAAAGSSRKGMSEAALRLVVSSRCSLVAILVQVVMRLACVVRIANHFCPPLRMMLSRPDCVAKVSEGWSVEFDSMLAHLQNGHAASALRGVAVGECSK